MLCDADKLQGNSRMICRAVTPYSVHARLGSCLAINAMPKARRASKLNVWLKVVDIMRLIDQAKPHQPYALTLKGAKKNAISDLSQEQHCRIAGTWQTE